MAEGIQIKNLPSTTTIKQGDTMTIVQDKQNKQLSLDVFVNESDLATLSVLENRCDEVKAKIEVDEYSAEITTSQSMSKIGSDDSGVDLHENVLDGAFESCVLKGKTKYRDIDTGEILEDFEEGRNLELITVRMPILTTTGKNLFDGKIENGEIDRNGNLDRNAKIRHRSINYINIKPNTQYYYSANIGESECNWIWYDSNKNYIIRQYTKNAVSPSNAHYLRYYSGMPEGTDLTKLNVQIEQNTRPTPYEPYKSSILSFNQKDDKTIVLRSLPNGVCDTLNVETGEYVQRIGELVMSGSLSEEWQVWTGTQNTESVYTFQLNRCNNEPSGTMSVCDKYLTYFNASKLNATLGEGVALSTGNGYLRILKTKVGSGSVDELKTYLASNPITVQYELTTPIIKTVDLSGYPFSYENGHVILSSGSTESSLTPIVTYKVPVSRVGQIASNTKSNLRQTIKLNQLEVLVYQSLINTEYENLLVQNSAESATSFTNLSTNDPKDELYYMLKHLIEEDQPVQNMLDKINLFYLYGLLSDEHYFDLLLGGEEDVY